MSDPTPSARTRLLATEVRDRFASEVDAALPSLVEVAQRAFNGVEAKDMRTSMNVHTATLELGQHASRWVDGMRQAWREALTGGETRMGAPLEMAPTELTLVGDDEVETRILASRLSLAVSDMASQELS